MKQQGKAKTSVCLAYCSLFGIPQCGNFPQCGDTPLYDGGVIFLTAGGSGLEWPWQGPVCPQVWRHDLNILHPKRF